MRNRDVERVHAQILIEPLPFGHQYVPTIPINYFRPLEGETQRLKLISQHAIDLPYPRTVETREAPRFFELVTEVRELLRRGGEQLLPEEEAAL